MDLSKLTLFCRILLVIAAVVQLLPAAAAFSPSLLNDLYGAVPADATGLLLLRHRAVLLGLVGLLLLAGAASEPLRIPAIALGLLSKVSFLVLFASAAASNPHTARVARADLVTASLLVVALIAGLRRTA
jgi:hypothetical protein